MTTNFAEPVIGRAFGATSWLAMTKFLDREIKYGDRSPSSEYVRRHADIMTMAVGLILRGDQAEQILPDNQADLIAIGREILNNPNRPADAALKPGE
jgi:2,4-dienoyl-CoA reductase-like NADH-dependent reductase (Old Yellow Enzyme family)